ncbi:MULTISPECIES: hypothetical protein [Methylorubrum]|uniref:hypothetical protein n=1 Tax=Methylorubrum TaxID=2282523 RepID=UPI001FEDE3FC|nr:hypothetical protein [Methylorubrum populi]
MAALVSGREDRARAAAETIASLATERTTLRAARAAFAAEVARLRAVLADAPRRRTSLERDGRFTERRLMPVGKA